MKFSPKKHQEIAIDYINTHDRCALFIPMGLGKSAATLAALDTFPVLVLAPLRVAQSTWPDEVKKWDFPYKVTPIIGSKKQREDALKIKSDIYTMNYENLPWLVEHLGSKWFFKTVVADELTRLKSFRLRQGGKQARALAMVAFTGVKKFIGLTGTPTPNGLIDLWGQLWFIDKGERLGRSFSAFLDTYFTIGYDGFTWNIKPGAADEIYNKIKDICLTIDPKEYFPTEEPIVNIIKVKMPSKAMELYKQMETEMFIEIEGEGIEAFNAATKTIKLLQLVNGAIYTEDGYEVVHEEKLKALEEIIEETSSPILVAYQFKSDLDRLLKHFPKGKHLDKDPNTLKQWNAGKIPLLFAHPASAGHGLSLQDGGNVIVYFSHGWNLEQHQQILERIGPARQKQAEYNRPVFVHHIVSDNTIELDVMDRLSGKATQQEILLRFLNKYRKSIDHVS